jgi:hypothetical protein
MRTVWSLVGTLALILILSIAMVAPARAAEMDMDGCSHDTTIESLRSCVEHAISQGHIDNVGIGRALLAKIDAAAKAVSTGDATRAVNILHAFISQVDAQSGRHIHAEHAAHLRSHAQAVIAALGNYR